ncbi:40S ribosomal protein S12, mitochondrial isoform X2 [Ischnura elegans]|nr:40S ribosomal protein S12, mitochondrial isoform X2 [Ischnura elegans]
MAFRMMQSLAQLMHRSMISPIKSACQAALQPLPLPATLPGLSVRLMASLAQMHRTGPHIKKRPPRKPLDGRPFAKGVVLKTLIRKPKKPNSANRKCVLVRLSGGKEMVAYVPGIGHNLQEHNIVLCRVGRCQDLIGVKIKCVRGKYDLAHVIKK